MPKTNNKVHEAQANLTKVAEDPDQCSEEPKANFCLGRQAPVHLVPIIFLIYAIYVVLLFIVHLRSGVD